MEMRKEKQCLNCREMKAVKDYDPDRYTRDKLTNWCSQCRRLQQTEQLTGPKKPTPKALRRKESNGSTMKEDQASK